MDQAAEKASHFALRTNCIEDPFEAPRAYRARGMVEQDFNQLKNWVDGDRLRVQNQSVQGKLFVCTLASSLRMILMMTAKKSERNRGNVQIPHDSIDSLLKNLELIRAQKRKNANAWIRNTIPAKRRRLLELLNLGEPPRVLRMGSR
jgi:transposase